MLLHISTLTKSTAAPSSPLILHQSFWGHMETLCTDANTEGKSFIEIYCALIITSIILYSQLWLSIIVALAVENPSKQQFHFIST